MTTTPRAKVKPLGDRHTQVTVSPRLAFVSKALKSKSVNRLVALYAGFDCLETAERFEEYVVLNWGKTSYEVIIRPGKRTLSKWEVKVRKPTDAQLAALVKKASQQPKQVAPAAQPVEQYRVLGRRMPTKVRGLSID